MVTLESLPENFGIFGSLAVVVAIVAEGVGFVGEGLDCVANGGVVAEEVEVVVLVVDDVTVVEAEVEAVVAVDADAVDCVVDELVTLC